MLISALSACHMLWFLHFAADAGIAVQAYEDDPEALGEVTAGGAGRFLSDTLQPRITVPAGTDLATANALHVRVHDVCFIARSVAFPVAVVARYRIAA
jgi:organic hydroperoxide reductase OsmC/OhrA